jgi:hypothetical protein
MKVDIVPLVGTAPLPPVLLRRPAGTFPHFVGDTPMSQEPRAKSQRPAR